MKIENIYIYFVKIIIKLQKTMTVSRTYTSLFLRLVFLVILSLISFKFVFFSHYNEIVIVIES